MARQDTEFPLKTVAFKNKADETECCRQILMNLPEYAIGVLKCTNWSYGAAAGDPFEFEIFDSEESKTYTLTRSKAVPAMLRIMTEWISGEIPGIPLSPGVTDSCQWDAVCVDLLLQYAIFNEERYC